MKVTIEINDVTGCRDCYFKRIHEEPEDLEQDYYYWLFCYHPNTEIHPDDNIITKYFEKPKTYPEWCPLKLKD